MCGPETSNRPRGGALAALNPPMDSVNTRSPVQGDLTFHTPGSPGSNSATHARLTPSKGYSAEGLPDLYVVIHSSGDMSRKARDCGMLHQFSFASPTSSSPEADFVELPLNKPLSLEVGNGGIIGRRVSLCSGDDVVVAEGIVGFNFLAKA